MTDIIQFLDTNHGSRLAWCGGEVEGRATVVFLHGHGSDMNGTKAVAVAGWAADNNFGMVRFDYSGHGASMGDFLDGTISAWKADCLAVIDTLTTGECILIGSSLGGWLMMLVARERRERIAGIIGIAAAPDFTRDLIWNALSEGEKGRMRQDGRIAVPNPYGAGDTIYPLHLIEDGEKHLILGGEIAVDCPVRLLHGGKDEEVPPITAERLAAAIISPDCEVIFDATADHRFSEPDQIDLLLSCLEAIVANRG